MLLPFLGLSLCLVDHRLVCYNAETGAPIGDYRAVFEAHQVAEAQACQQEAEARREAEARARQEAEARRAAETRLQELEAELWCLRGDGPQAPL